MVQKYDDDEQLIDVQVPDVSGSVIADKTTATYFSKVDAPLNATNFKVLLALKGSEASTARPGVDIVMVLDVSGSMMGKKLEHMKTATKFLVKKLSPIDRLSVIKYSTEAHRLCPLRWMNDDAQTEIADMIDDLKHGGRTNTTEGVEKAVRVLQDRRLTNGREVAIMLMSDGEPNPIDADGSQVPVHNVPVYTFGFGQNYDPKVLLNIARRSKNGTFSAADVDNTETSNLSVAFSQCLAGLLSVVVQDLTLTITKVGPTIKKVSAGDYFQSRDEFEGSITISFDNLYRDELRSVLVDIALDSVTESQDIDILEFTYSYKDPINQKVYDVNPVIVTVSRTENPTTQESPEVLIEEAHQDTAAKIREAMEMADAKRFEEAMSTIEYAKLDLNRNGINNSHPKVKALTSELDQFLKLLESPVTYEKLGRAFALSAELSHGLQRFAAKGNVDDLRMFATHNMDQLLSQVRSYEKDPTISFSDIQIRLARMALLDNDNVADEEDWIRFHKAAREGKLDVIGEILVDNEDIIQSKNDIGCTALHEAAFNGQIGSLKKIFEVVESSSELKRLMLEGDHCNNTPLHYAIKSGHEKTVYYLVDMAPRATYKLNQDGVSPLALAVEKGYPDMVTYMTRANISASIRDRLLDHAKKISIAHIALKKRNPAVLQAIMEGIPELINVPDKKGWKLLSFAAFEDCLEEICYILNKFPDSITKIDEDGSFPIHKAVAGGHVRVIKEFIFRCPQSLQHIDKRGRNILQLATLYQSKDVLAYLKEETQLTGN